MTRILTLYENIKHSSFSFRELEAASDLSSQRAYLEATAERLGAGEWRTVYAVSADCVVKIVKSDDSKYLDHNATEVRVARKRSARVPRVIKTSFDVTGDYEWIAVERVTPVNGAALDDAIAAELSPISSLDELVSVIDAGLTDSRFAADRESHARFERAHEKMMRNTAYREIFDTISSNDLKAREELHDENWGVRASGELVLLDAGV